MYLEVKEADNYIRISKSAHIIELRIQGNSILGLLKSLWLYNIR